MQISYFAVMDNPEDEAALNAELARLRRIEQAARKLVRHDPIMRGRIAQEYLDALRAALESTT